MKLPKTKSKTIFVLSAAGSAVGMANVWGFPYKFHKGGLFFLIFYLFFISLFAYVGLSSEFAIGRMCKGSVVYSYEKAIKTRFKNSKIASFYGYIPMIVSLIIAIGYTIIVSYVAKAFIDTLNGTLATTSSSLWFENFSSRSFAVIETHLAIVIVAIIMSLGGFKSMQRINSILMPTMIVIYIIVMIRMSGLERIEEGYRLLFRVDFENLSIGTAISAMGDALFGLSITGFGMIFMGRMLADNQDVIVDSKLTALFDTLVALLSAFIVVPAIVVFEMGHAKGPELIFHILPTIFANIPIGRGFACLFYLAIIMAGLTSLQNIFESVGDTLVKKCKISDKLALGLVGSLVFLLGVFLHPIGIWEPFMDITLYYIIPLGAVSGSIIWFYVMDKDVLLREINKGAKKKQSEKFVKIGRYLYTPLVIIICILSIISH